MPSRFAAPLAALLLTAALAAPARAELAAFTPANAFETVILAAKQGAVPIATLLAALPDAPLTIASMTPVQPNGAGFTPLILEQADKPLVWVFTSPGRQQPGDAPYMLQMTGRDFIQWLQPGYGIVLNPGYTAQLAFTPQAASDLRAKLKAH